MKIIASILIIYFMIATLILLYFLFGNVKWMMPDKETGKIKIYDEVSTGILFTICLLWIIIIPKLLMNRRKYDE